MPLYFWMITCMKNVNNFQIAKVQPGVAYKRIAYKKACSTFLITCGLMFLKELIQNLQDNFLSKHFWVPEICITKSYRKF